jgi:uncharacterized protein (DUF1810 family)
MERVRVGQFDALFDRIKNAQNGGARCVPYSQALREIGFGKKRSHWIWYVIPSHKSIRPTTRKPQFLLPSIEAHRAYLGNEILRKRFMDILVVTLSHLNMKGKTLKQIYGSIDSLKVRETCSMFAIASFLELKNLTYTTEEYAKSVLELCVAVLLGDVKKRVTNLSPKALRVLDQEYSTSSSKHIKTTADLVELVEKSSSIDIDDRDDSTVTSTKVQEDEVEKEKQRRPMFEWKDRDKWVRFSQEISDTIHRALSQGKHIVKYDAAGKTYVLNLTRMVQRNMRTHFERDVRLVKEPVVKNKEEEYEWMWFDDDNWIAYELNIAHKLEFARRHNAKHVSFMTSNGRRYRVNLVKMTQTNLRSNRSRRVRRSLKGTSSTITTDDDDDEENKNKKTFVPSLPPPVLHQNCTFSNAINTSSSKPSTVVIDDAAKRSRNRAMRAFKPKRPTGPLRNYCENCSLHKSKHESLHESGKLCCPIASVL